MKLTQEEKYYLRQAVESYCGDCSEETLKKEGRYLDSAINKIEGTPTRIQILEETARMNMTGEDIMEQLPPKEAEEYAKLLMDDE